MPVHKMKGIMYLRTLENFIHFSETVRIHPLAMGKMFNEHAKRERERKASMAL